MKKPPAPPTKDAADQYTVGYGRPPLETRFKPGQSGNPKGRPRRTRSLRAKLCEMYMAPIKLREGSRIINVSRIEALLRQQLFRAIKGDERAARQALKTAENFGVFYDVAYFGLTSEELRYLSDQTLDDLDSILRMREKDAATQNRVPPRKG